MAKKKTAKAPSKAAAQKATPNRGAKKAAPSKPAAKLAAPKAPKPISLRRPTVGIDEDLDLFFKEDYGARNIFKFLLARTVRDLEQWSPDDIVKKLSAPIRASVEAIRLRLAQHHRSLKGDEEYALQHQEKSPS